MCNSTVAKADPLKVLGAQVRQFRERRGWSQEALGEIADLHRNEIGSIERGEKNLSFINLLRICRALSISPSELLAPFTLDSFAKLPPKRRSAARIEK
jgi:transcriptional regulator with XRE-family HTH domain